VYLEVWRDERSAGEHLRSPHYDLLLDLMEASMEEPHLEFFFVSSTRDVSWVAELRDTR
jgi:quinol monooxygenase YgiN